MNKVIKEALAKGKVLREELDEKVAEAARIFEEQRKAVKANKDIELKAEAERLLSYVPEALSKAVAVRQASFPIMTYQADHNDRFIAVAKLIEPKLKKMGLQFKHTTSTEWRQLSYDPDTGYDATYYHLEVIVPNEDL